MTGFSVIILSPISHIAKRALYSEVQLDSIPEIKVFHMLVKRCHTKNRKGSIKQHKNYFNFRSKIQLDHSVQSWSKIVMLSFEKVV